MCLDYNLEDYNLEDYNLENSSICNIRESQVWTIDKDEDIGIIY
jgi:hypothetical protein